MVAKGLGVIASVRSARRHRRRGAGVSAEAHHRRRPVRRGRADRHGGAPPRRGDGQVARDSRSSSRTWAARAARSARPGWPRPRRTATRSCSTTSANATAPALYRKLPYDTIGDFEPIGLINDVPMTLVARKDFPPNGPPGADRLRQGEQGQGHLRQRGPRRGVPPLRHAVHERDRHRPDDGAVQGHGPGHERPPGRPGGLHVRPDHQHHQPDQGRQDQGVRRHDEGRGCPRCRRSRPCTRPGCRASRSRSGTPSTRRRARRSRSIDKLARALQEALRDATVKQRFAELGAEPCRGEPRDARGAARPPQGRDRQVGADHQEGRGVCRLTRPAPETGAPSRAR